MGEEKESIDSHASLLFFNKNIFAPKTPPTSISNKEYIFLHSAQCVTCQ